MINREEFELRKEALNEAETYMHSICGEYPPEQYSDKVSPANVFTSPTTNTTTPAEQAVNLMITIADWLIQVN